ncbi:MAG: hypothetical protein HWE34_13345 [Methylocystaceae bacterium]|nr:hypothetical protein [Methylocystaceae bacterium]
MSMSQFRPEDWWVYVADSMGRLGQGYYKNRANPSQTITPQEFEKRRRQEQLTTIKSKEQNINTELLATVGDQGQSGQLKSATSSSVLSPWENPVFGEQRDTTSTQQKETPQAEPVGGQQKTVQTQEESQPNSQKRPGAGRESTGNIQNTVTTGESSDKGGNGGAGGAAKVICSELVRQGMMTEKHRRDCTVYALSRLPPSFMTGYHFWAVPYVRVMRRSKFATILMGFFVKHRTQEVRRRLGRTVLGSGWGSLICALHDPLCSWMGRFVPESDYRSLYESK